MSSATTIRICDPDAHACKPNRPSFLERTRVWLKNLWNWRTAWAVRHLSKQLQRDKAFRDAWHANIAMPIYDTLNAEGVWHQPAIKRANQCADRLMEHLFDA